MGGWKAPTDRVIIAVEPEKKTTDAGIYLPDKMKGTKVRTAKVLAAGPDAKNILPGDTVYYAHDAAVKLTDDVFSVSEEFVMAATREE